MSLQKQINSHQKHLLILGSIMVMSHERHGIPNHRYIDCFFQHLIQGDSKENIKIRITGSCWGDSNEYRWIPVTKGE